MKGKYIHYKGEQREIEAKWGDIYLLGDEYRIGDPISGTPINIETKHGKVLSYLLGHIYEDIPYETLSEVSGSKDIRSLMVGLRCQMRNSTRLKFARRPRMRFSGVRLESRL